MSNGGKPTVYSWAVCKSGQDGLDMSDGKKICCVQSGQCVSGHE